MSKYCLQTQSNQQNLLMQHKLHTKSISNGFTHDVVKKRTWCYHHPHTMTTLCLWLAGEVITHLRSVHTRLDYWSGATKTAMQQHRRRTERQTVRDTLQRHWFQLKPLWRPVELLSSRNLWDAVPQNASSQTYFDESLIFFQLSVKAA